MKPWTPSRLESFRHELDRARKARKAAIDTYDWDGNLERYVPLPREANGTKTWDVNVGADFQDVERKKAALFYDRPVVSFMPEDATAPVTPPQPPPQPGQPPPPPPLTFGTLCAWHQQLVNTLLGPEYADTKRTVQQILFDTLCPAGFGLVQTGYDVTTVEVQSVDPMTGQPTPQQVPVHEEWFVGRVSPYAALIPADHRDTDIDHAPWIGFEFEVPVSEARRRFRLPPEWKPKGGKAEERPYFEDDVLQSEMGADTEALISGCIVQYRPAALATEDDPQFHPLAIADLVLLDGEDEPLVHQMSPHQQIGQDGRMTPDSITEFTIKRLTLRDRTDQTYVPSDCTVTAPLTKELNKYRSITVRQRDGNRMVMLYDPEKLNPEVRDKIAKGDVGAWVPVEPGALDTGQAMLQVTQLSQGRENWTGQDYIERDRERILGIGANQVGVQSRGSKTATEVQNTQQNTEARFEQERQRVLGWYLDVVRVFDLLVIRYADARTAGAILGPQIGQLWAQHKGALAGMYRYEIQIDSGKYIDVEANKRQWLQLLNMIGQSQHVNVVPILKKLASAFGMDPAQVVIDQPPKKGPEPPKVNLTVNSDHLNPALPQFPLVLELLAQGGYQISPQAVAAAKQQAQIQATVQAAVVNTTDTPTPQPGPEPPQLQQTLPKMPTLNQHQSEESGNLTGPDVS